MIDNINQDAFKLYSSYLQLRMEAFYLRRGNQLSADPVLSKYPFCNNYRFLDWGSQRYLECVNKSTDKVLGGLLFDLFKREDTFNIIYQCLDCDITWNNFNSKLDHVISSLTKQQDIGNTIYTNGYIMPCITSISNNKATSWLIHLHDNQHKLKQLNTITTLEESFNLFKSITGFGDFLAMQFAIDLSWIDNVKYDGYDFVVPGNGAVRGLAKLGLSKKQMISFLYYLTDNQSTLFNEQCFYNGIAYCPMDFQNTFCEFDKYTRSPLCPTTITFDNGKRNKMKRNITNPREVKDIIVPNNLQLIK